MKIHVLQHVSFENAGTIYEWAEERNFSVDFTRFFRQEVLPEPEDFDMLIILGGPMNLNETQKYPWLVQEKTFLKRCIATGKKMLGICLGAQLLAETLGLKVFRNKQKEIGWFPVWKNNTVDNEILKLFDDDALPAFHWHGDTFDLPKQAIRLFSSQITDNQAFSWNNQVFGLQFHWEVKPENVRLLVEKAAEDMTDSPFVQQSFEMINDTGKFILARKNMFRFLDFIRDCNEEKA